MKAPELLLTSLLITASILGCRPVRAQDGGSGGSHVGGGGNPDEMRVDTIRQDILEWIEKGGAQGLKFPPRLSLQEYESKMRQILRPQEVVVGFVSDDSSLDEELRVQVDGRPKACRGFKSQRDQKLHILCHTADFKRATEPEQYQLIHHEYAGLARLERNEGAASDYQISKQLSSYLRVEKVLKLAVVRKTLSCQAILEHTGLFDEHRSLAIKLLKERGYQILDFKDPRSTHLDTLKIGIASKVDKLFDKRQLNSGTAGFVRIKVATRETPIYLVMDYIYEESDILALGEAHEKKRFLRKINWEKAVRSAIWDLRHCRDLSL